MGNNDYDTRVTMQSFDLALSSLIGDLDADGTHIAYQSAVSKGFKEIAGQTVSEHTKAVHFDKGVVTVVMDAGIWAQELTFLAEEYREKLNKLLGGDVVTALRFCTRSMR
ncbi:MAG: DUF721 domain-containing protein [Coriobacteriia bacterium]|nr:DUF721 domain-containing protein [Coriobacteriia bacterium]